MTEENMKGCSIVAFFCSCLFVTGCNSLGVKSQAKHQLDMGPKIEYEFFFKKVSEADFVTFGLMASEHAISQSDANIYGEKIAAIQNTHDHVHAIMAAKYPSMNISKPEVFVAESTEINAAVMPIALCFDNISFELFASPQATNATHDFVSIIQGRIEKGILGEMSAKCITTTASDELIVNIHSWLNIYLGGFLVKLEKIGAKWQFSATQKSPDAYKYLGNLHGRTLVLPYIPNFVYYTKALIESLPEEELVAVAGHELGHYYLGHIPAPNSTFQNLYKITGTNLDHKPMHDPQYDEFGQQMFRTMSELDYANIARKEFQGMLPEGVYPDRDPTRFHAAILFEMSVALMSAGQQLDLDGKPFYSQCSVGMSALTQSPVFPKIMNQLDQYSSGDIANLDALDSIYEKCFEQVLFSHNHAPFKMEMLMQLIAGGANPARAKYFPETIDSAGSYLAFWQELSKNLHLKYPKFSEANYRSAQTIFRKIDEIDSDEEFFTKTLRELESVGNEQRIGYYSYEQEADEVSLEWLNRMGVNPFHAIASEWNMMRLGVGGDKDSRSAELDYSACLELYNNDWRQPDGKEVLVPVGNYTDPHHQGCFRVYNLLLEQKVHKYSLYRPLPISNSFLPLRVIHKEVSPLLKCRYTL
jgi:hypothetical protein